ncbi:MAG TPA: WecB/TagA/CpsF family glycosyltransferase [Polyangia bacterium]|nr:WecB/TagA/CpsF family glycosyltransferase [Polyangia bacterium]
MKALAPAASLWDVARGRASLVGARFAAGLRPGLVSPVEARLNMGIAYDDLADEERRYLAGRTWRSDLGVVARAALSRLYASTPKAIAPRRPFVVSAEVDNLTLGEALDRLFATPPRDRALVSHFVHPHALNLAVENDELRGALRRADLVLPDGAGIRLGGRVIGFSLRQNLNGTDMLPALCARAAREGVPLVLIGAAPDVAEACAARLREQTPGLEIPVVRHGFLSEAESAAVAAEVGALGRALVLVAMGSPHQERWTWKHLAAVGGASVVTVGGLFDFYSGRVPRAPLAWRELGLEWVFRFLQEPRRLARRYLLGNPLFMLRAMRQRLLGVPAKIAS